MGARAGADTKCSVYKFKIAQSLLYTNCVFGGKKWKRKKSFLQETRRKTKFRNLYQGLVKDGVIPREREIFCVFRNFSQIALFNM